MQPTEVDKTVQCDLGHVQATHLQSICSSPCRTQNSHLLDCGAGQMKTLYVSCSDCQSDQSEASGTDFDRSAHKLCAWRLEADLGIVGQ